MCIRVYLFLNHGIFLFAQLYPFFTELNSMGHEVEVFPYSIFYVYYEQYLTMWRDTLTSLAISLLTILVISFLLTGFNIGSAVVIIVHIVMIITDILGAMYFWDISLNAVSLVNLVMVRIVPPVFTVLINLRMF